MARRPAPSTVLRRFWAKVDQTPNPAGCWIWTGAKVWGYGELHRAVGKPPHKAHRLSWEIHHGPIPANMEICHRCDNRSCVNPDHLFVGTHADNMADAASKGIMPRGKARSHTKLTAQAVSAIRGLQGKVPAVELANRYGVSVSLVYMIWNRSRWSWLE